jgi:DhnA family fructose-bisphosphate aldolase class Ia
VKYVKHAARVGAELGADIVKVAYTGSAESFREVVEGCPLPVVIAGGEKVSNDEDMLRMVHEALEAGAAGVSIGRNAFGHEKPTKVVEAMSGMVHNRASVEAAMEVLRS